MQQKVFNFFLPQEAGNNIVKEQQKPCQKFKKTFLQRILNLPAIQCKW